MGGKRESPPQYSRAFENIVEDDEDVTQLLAYALYKRAIREDAELGVKSSGATRNPSRTVVETYRQAAERKLDQVIQGSLEQAKPELQISAALDAVEAARSSIQEHVTKRTGFWPAIGTNVLAWAFTLIITLLIVLLFNRPDVPHAVQRQVQQQPQQPAPQTSIHNSN